MGIRGHCCWLTGILQVPCLSLLWFTNEVSVIHLSSLTEMWAVMFSMGSPGSVTPPCACHCWLPARGHCPTIPSKWRFTQDLNFEDLWWNSRKLRFLKPKASKQSEENPSLCGPTQNIRRWRNGIRGIHGSNEAAFNSVSLQLITCS